MSNQILDNPLRHFPLKVRNHLFNFAIIIQQLKEKTNINYVYVDPSCKWSDVFIIHQLKTTQRFYWACIESDSCYQDKYIEFNMVTFLQKYFNCFKVNQIRNVQSFDVYTTLLFQFKPWFKEILEIDDIPISGHFTCWALSQETVQELKEIFLKYYPTSLDRTLYFNFLEKFRIINYFQATITTQLYFYLNIDKRYINLEKTAIMFMSSTANWFLEKIGKMQDHLLVKNVDRWIKNFENNFSNLDVVNMSKWNLSCLQQCQVGFGPHYPEEWIQFLDDTKQQILYVVTESTFLTSLRFVQFLSKKRDFLFLSTKQLGHTEISSKAAKWLYKKDNGLLLIEYEGVIHRRGPISGDISIVAGNRKKIVSICSHKESFYDMLKSRKHISNCLCISDNISLADMDEQTKQDLFSNTELSFQGHHVYLKEIVDSTVEKILDMKILEKLVNGGELEFGNKLPTEDSYFIPRTLRRPFISKQTLANSVWSSNAVVVFQATEEDFDGFNLQITRWESKNKNCKPGIFLFPKYSEKRIHDYEDINIYWMHHKSGLLFIEKISQHNSDILDIFEDIQYSEKISISDLCSNWNVQYKINIIADYPGSGKTVFLKHFATELKKHIPYIWVIHVNFSNDTNAVMLIYRCFEKNNILNPEDAAEWIVEYVSKLDVKEWRCEEKLLYLSLISVKDQHRHPTTVLLFDAFDELIPSHQIKAIRMFRALASRNNVLWITCRLHQQGYLEKELHSSAYRLNPLTCSESNMYWNRLLDMKNNVKDLHDIPFLKSVDIVDGIPFSGNPLHVNLLSQIVGNNLHQIMPLPVIFKKFIQLKVQLYYSSKVPYKGMKSTKNSEGLINGHIYIAVKECIPGIREKYHPITQEEYLRVGLLICNKNKLTFLHSSVRDYLVAAYISRNASNIPISAGEDFFSEDKFLQLRIFLNTMLNRTSLCLIPSKRYNSIDMLKKIVNEGNNNLAKLLLDKIC